MPGDHDLYLAGFADDNHECLRLLLFHAADVAQLSRMALAAQISINDAEGVHLLLGAGADPNRYADDADPPSPVVYAAIRSRCSIELTGLLLGHGADPDAPVPTVARPTPWSPPRAAPAWPCCYASTVPPASSPVPTGCWPPARTRTGPRSGGCWPRTRGLPGRVPAAQQAAAMIPAESDNTAAIALLLDRGFPVDARGDDGGTALHAAAYSGSAPAVRLLLDHGAGVEARDSTWDSTPVEWAAIGSGEQPASHPHPDWTEPCKPCSTRAPQPGTSPCHPMTPSHPAPKSPLSCAATAASNLRPPAPS